MLPARLTGRAASAVLVLVSLALAAACKRDPAPDATADAAVAASASSLAPPLAPPATLDAAATRHDDERPLDPKLAPLVDAVVTDPLVSEGFLLLHDGMDTESVDQLLAKNCKSASLSTLGCAYGRVHAALDEASSRDAVIARCLADLLASLTREIEGRKVDVATLKPDCARDAH